MAVFSLCEFVLKNLLSLLVTMQQLLRLTLDIVGFGDSGLHLDIESLVFTRDSRNCRTAIARLSHRNSVRPSVCLSVCHTGGSGKNGAS